MMIISLLELEWSKYTLQQRRKSWTKACNVVLINANELTLQARPGYAKPHQMRYLW